MGYSISIGDRLFLKRLMPSYKTEKIFLEFNGERGSGFCLSSVGIRKKDIARIIRKKVLAKIPEVPEDF